MNDLAPYATAILSGVLIPLLIYGARWLKKVGERQVMAIESRIQNQSSLIEARLTASIELGNKDIKESLMRMDEMNGKIAAVMVQQASDHDRVVWLLGNVNHPIEERKEPL